MWGLFEKVPKIYCTAIKIIYWLMIEPVTLDSPLKYMNDTHVFVNIELSEIWSRNLSLHRHRNSKNSGNFFSYLSLEPCCFLHGMVVFAFFSKLWCDGSWDKKGNGTWNLHKNSWNALEFHWRFLKYLVGFLVKRVDFFEKLWHNENLDLTKSNGNKLFKLWWLKHCMRKWNKAYNG